VSALRYVIDQSWFLMMSSYSRRFSLGITQCGPLFAICLTDHGGNNSTLDLNISKKDSIAPFLQAIGHLTLASDVDVGDDPNFRTFGGSYDMIFPYAEGYLSSLKITSRLFHNFSFTGKGTQIFLATPTSPLAGATKPVAVKDSWPTPAEIHEAYLIKHIRASLSASLGPVKQGEPVDEHACTLAHELNIQDFPDVLHEYFCECEHPIHGGLVHDATNVRRSFAVIAPTNDRILMRESLFERRVRYRLVFQDVVVDSTWFASRREYFTCVLRNLKGTNDVTLCEGHWELTAGFSTQVRC
jgi:hypothetical protein